MDFGLGFGCFLQAHPALKSVLVLNVADLLVASFIFLLFVSIYRKRSKPAVRFWVIGWGSVLLHFAAQAMHPSSETGQTVQSMVSLSMLVLCGTAFALSYPASHASGRRQRWIGISLGVPWLLSMVLVGGGRCAAQRAGGCRCSDPAVPNATVEACRRRLSGGWMPVLAGEYPAYAGS